MKITKQRLIEIIKEELKNNQMESEFKKPNYASDDYWKMQKVLTDKFGDTYQKIDGRYQLVQTPAKQKLVKEFVSQTKGRRYTTGEQKPIIDPSDPQFDKVKKLMSEGF